MKYFVVIDTNVLVSAVLKYNSIPGTIIEFAFNGKIIPVLNKEIESEYRNVLYFLSPAKIELILSVP